MAYTMTCKMLSSEKFVLRLQILDSLLQHVNAVFRKPQHRVATKTQQPSKLSCFVVMVYIQSLTLAALLFFVTEKTEMVLFLRLRLNLRFCQAISSTNGRWVRRHSLRYSAVCCVWAARQRSVAFFLQVRHHPSRPSVDFRHTEKSLIGLGVWHFEQVFMMLPLYPFARAVSRE